jgi:hypothetical protein
MEDRHRQLATKKYLQVPEYVAWILVPQHVEECSLPYLLAKLLKN